MSDQDLVATIRLAIYRSGLSQRQLAERTGLHLTTINRFATGERDLYGASLSKLCEVLGLRIVSAGGKNAAETAGKKKSR